LTKARLSPFLSLATQIRGRGLIALLG